MGISLDGGRSISSGVKDVFVNKDTTVKVDDNSGKTPRGWTAPADIWLDVHLEVGLSFQPIIRIAGNYKRNEAGQITAFTPRLFNLQAVMKEIGCTGNTNDDGTLPEAWLRMFVGKEVYRLSYVSYVKKNGKRGYTDADAIWLVANHNPQQLATNFLAQYELRGFPKNYHPEILDDLKGDSFPGPEVEPPLVKKL